MSSNLPPNLGFRGIWVLYTCTFLFARFECTRMYMVFYAGMVELVDTTDLIN